MRCWMLVRTRSWTRGWFRVALLALVTSVAASCGGGAASTSRAGPRVLPGATAHAVELELPVDDTEIVGSVTVRVRSLPGARARDVLVRFERTWLDRNGALTRVPGAVVVPAFGLYASTVNEVEVDVGFVGGGAEAFALDVQTPPEAAGPLPWTVQHLDPDVALDFFFVQAQGPPCVVDVDGRVRWCAPPLDEPVFPFVATADGVLVGSMFTSALHRVDWAGRVAKGQLRDVRCRHTHHNLEPGKIGYLDTVTWRGDDYTRPQSVLVEVTPDGDIVHVWDFDRIVGQAIRDAGEAPAGLVRPGVDWFHMNSAVYDPSDDSILASSRESFVIKVDYATGAIRWILGNPEKLWFSGYPKSLAPLALAVNGSPPIGQHALSVSPDGTRLLCFDNGRGNIVLENVGDDRLGSRVVEFTIDADARTATETWVYDLDPADSSGHCSSAMRTRAGDVLLVSSAPAAGGPARVFLVTDDGRVAFRAMPTEGTCDAAYHVLEAPWSDLVLE